MADVNYEYTDERSINPDLICAICHCPFNNPCHTQCNHYYCRECITHWRHEHNTCPLCKRPPGDLKKAENISDALNRLLVTCTKCGRSDIRRGQFADHINNQCSGIQLYVSRNRREGFSHEHNDVDLAVPIMDPSGSLINQLTEQIRKFRDELQHQKTIINRHNEQIDNLKKQQNEIQAIKQSNTKQRTKIEKLEHIIQTQKEQIQELKSSINQLQNSNRNVQNHIQLYNEESNVYEGQICNLWEKINQILPQQNAQLENDITEKCPFGSELILCDKNLTDRDMEIVVKRAIINKQCSSLDLGENKITYQGTLIIADTFHQNIKLEILNLSYNHLMDKGIQFLAEALLGNTTLKELNLGSTGMTNKGINYLTKMLEVNETLKNLDINGNKFDDDGMKLLADVLSKDNQTLRILFIHSNKLITDKSVNSIIDMFRHNQSLKRIELHQCGFSRGGETKLQDEADKKSDDISICI